MKTSRKILIVDDEPEIREELAEYLADKGYQVSKAGDGLEAFAKFQSEGADAVIVDMKMPRCDGEELIWQLRGIAPSMPIIVVTGHYSKADLEKGRRAGGTAAIKKPVSLRELNEILNTLLK